MQSRVGGKIRRYASAEEFLRLTCSPVLNSEDQAEFDNTRRALEYDLDPQAFIEQMYVTDIAGLVWEIRRLHRLKRDLLNLKFQNASRDELKQQCTAYEDSEDSSYPHAILDEEKFDRLNALVNRWFTDDKAKQKASAILNGYEINETEIWASVIKEQYGEGEHNEAHVKDFDDAIVKLEFRRDKALKCLADYRYVFGAKNKKSTHSIVESESTGAPLIEDKKVRKPAA